MVSCGVCFFSIYTAHLFCDSSADGVASFLRADLSLLRADLLLTARGTACLPPEGRQVYRPWDGKFTARGAVSLPPVGR